MQTHTLTYQYAQVSLAITQMRVVKRLHIAKLTPTMVYIFVGYFDVTYVLLVTYQEEISIWLAKLVRDVSEVCGVGMSSLLLVEKEGKRKRVMCVCVGGGGWSTTDQLVVIGNNAETAVRLPRSSDTLHIIIQAMCIAIKTRQFLPNSATVEYHNCS